MAESNLLSPRKLDAMRANGSQIVAGSQEEEKLRAVNGDTLESMKFEMNMNNNLHLVPCRWEKSGWRYVQKDPNVHNFFNNPNRVNSFGIGADKRRYASQVRSPMDSFYASGSGFNRTKGSGAGETTYGRTFVQQK